MKFLSTITALIAVAFLSIAPASANISPVQDVAPSSEVVCPDGTVPFTEEALAVFLSNVPGLAVAIEKEFPDGTFGVLFDFRGVEGYDPSAHEPYYGLLFYSDTLSDGSTGWCFTGIAAYFSEQDAQDLWGLVRSDIY